MRAQYAVRSPCVACLGLAAIAGCAAASTPSHQRRQGGAARAVSPDSAAVAPTASRRAARHPGVNVAAFDALARQEATAWARSPLAKVWRTGLVVLERRQPDLGTERRLPVGRGQAGLHQRRPRLHRAAAVRRPGRRRHLARRLDHEGASAQRGAGLRRADKQQAVPGLRDDAARRHGGAAHDHGRRHEPGHRQRARLGVHPQGSVRAGHPGGAAAGQLRHAVHATASPTEKLRPLGAVVRGRRTVTPSADGRTLTLGLRRQPLRHDLGRPGAEVGGVVVVGGWMHDPNPDQACAGVLLLRRRPSSSRRPSATGSSSTRPRASR